MTEPIATRDGQTVAAWLLKANPKQYDALGALEAYGVIDSFSVHETYRLDLMQEGQRCFLYVGGDEGGIWGVGEVTGPVFTSSGGDDGFYVDLDKAEEVRRFVPVEILRLANPVPRADLLARPELADCELFRSPQQGNPNVLRPDEVAALDSFDLSVIEPTKEQLENLAAIDDPSVLIVFDGDVTYEIVDLVREDPAAFRVVRMDGAVVEQLGIFEDFEDALDSLAAIVDEIGRSAPIYDLDFQERDLVPILVALVEDGTLTIARVGKAEFAGLHETEESDEINILDGYGAASEAMFDLLSGEDEEDDS